MIPRMIPIIETSTILLIAIHSDGMTGTHGIALNRTLFILIICIHMMVAIFMILSDQIRTGIIDLVMVQDIPIGEILF